MDLDLELDVDRPGLVSPMLSGEHTYESNLTVQSGGPGPESEPRTLATDTNLFKKDPEGPVLSPTMAGPCRFHQHSC